MKNNKTGIFEISARTMIYQFLALALYEPTENLLAAVKENDYSEKLLAASRQFLGSQGEKLTETLLTALCGTGENRETSLLDLKVEYNRLFVGPMPPVCPPYESFFDKKRPQEGQGTLLGPTSEAMADALNAEGLTLTLDYAELPDHMAIELEFMYYLLLQAEAGEKDSELYLEKANSFLINHLSPWLPEFGAKVSLESRHPFYQSIGLLLEAMIKADLKSVTSQK